jgi:hypothetical protein
VEAFQFIEDIVEGIKKTIYNSNPSTSEYQKQKNKGIYAVADCILDIVRDIQTMLKIMRDKGQTDCAGLLELTLQSYPPITYETCNKTLLETAQTYQIPPLRNIIFAQIHSEQALQRQLTELSEQNTRLQNELLQRKAEQGELDKTEASPPDLEKRAHLLTRLNRILAE